MTSIVSWIVNRLANYVRRRKPESRITIQTTDTYVSFLVPCNAMDIETIVARSEPEPVIKIEAV